MIDGDAVELEVALKVEVNVSIEEEDDCDHGGFEFLEVGEVLRVDDLMLMSLRK